MIIGEERRADWGINCLALRSGQRYLVHRFKARDRYWVNILDHTALDGYTHDHSSEASKTHERAVRCGMEVSCTIPRPTPWAPSGIRLRNWEVMAYGGSGRARS